ncbi:sugar transferase [Brevundimonas sp.]|uniref:sugar transferase n=1 Tax=Brevundimonas sp. TaxID=1871086 RepID=UPI002FCA6FB0
MSEQGLSQVQNEPLHLAHDKARRRRVSDNLFFSVCILLICFVVLPVLYARAPIRVPIAEMLKGPQLTHILANCTANALVMLSALISRGDRLDRKLAGVLSNTLVVHGALAFFILIARQPYSNLILPLAVIVSVFGGVLIMYVQHRSVRPRIAVLGERDPAIETALMEDHDYVNDPRADLRAYDILLTMSIVNLSPEWAGALSRAMLGGKRVRHLAEFSEERRGIVAIDHFDLEHLPPGGLTSYRTRKRLLDIGLILVTAPITVPLVLLAMLAILVTMGRPVFFIQERVGLGGKPFRMYKLRTMRPPSADGAARTTEVGDARVTALGRILRRYRIDELPQLWNVLKGHMSIIGPRPEWTVLSEQYTAELPVYAYRHLVRPGITGWAQVRGGYAGDLAETRVKVGYDLFYIKNMSFSMDSQILVRTVWTLLTGSGAR